MNLTSFCFKSHLFGAAFQDAQYLVNCFGIAAAPPERRISDVNNFAERELPSPVLARSLCWDSPGSVENCMQKEWAKL